MSKRIITIHVSCCTECPFFEKTWTSMYDFFLECKKDKKTSPTYDYYSDWSNDDEKLQTKWFEECSFPTQKYIDEKEWADKNS